MLGGVSELYDRLCASRASSKTIDFVNELVKFISSLKEEEYDSELE